MSQLDPAVSARLELVKAPTSPRWLVKSLAYAALLSVLYTADLGKISNDKINSTDDILKNLKRIARDNGKLSKM